jgi:hypothetical protein
MDQCLSFNQIQNAVVANWVSFPSDGYKVMREANRLGTLGGIEDLEENHVSYT